LHSFARHNHRPCGQALTTETNGLVLKRGWRYDLHEWLIDTCLFRGKGHELRQRTVTLAGLHPGETVAQTQVGDQIYE
jgi:hypothetical protein